MTLENTVEKAVSPQDPCKTALGKSHITCKLACVTGGKAESFQLLILIKTGEKHGDVGRQGERIYGRHE